MGLKVMNVEPWEPRLWHKVFGAKNIWRQTSEGIEVRGEKGPRRTKGEPSTLTRIIDTWGEQIDHACTVLNLPRELMAGVIGAESKGTLDARKFEDHLSDASIGLTQVLTSTALFLAKQAPTELKLAPVLGLMPLPQGGKESDWKPVMTNPTIAIGLGAMMLRVANDTYDCRMDPVLSYAVYNAGSLRPNDKNPWGMHYYRKYLPKHEIWADAMNSFTRWYGDACAVYATC